MTIQMVIRSLEKLNDIHEELLMLGKEKMQVLIHNQVDQLTKLTNRESRLMKQVVEQEQIWLEATAKFLQEKGLQPNPSLTMSELIKLVFRAEEKMALQEAQRKLMDTIQKLKEMNSLNQQMLEQSLSFIDYTLDLLAGDSEELMYHNPADQKRVNKNVRIFDTKA